MQQITKANAKTLLKPGKKIWVMGNEAKIVSLQGTQLRYKFTKTGGNGFLDMMYIDPELIVKAV